MNKQLDLEHDSLSKLFFSFAAPSILGMLIVSAQIMIDGLFLSAKVGALGLAAVNLSMPVISIMLSIALMIVSGGIVITGVAKGSKDEKLAAGFTTLTITIYATVLASLSAIILLNIDAVCNALGATGQIHSYVRSYLGYMAGGAVLYCLPNLTEAFARLNGRPNFVLVSGIICLSINVILDYLFIFRLDMGMSGAALATIGANTTAAIILSPLVKCARIRGTLRDIKNIFFNGSSEMITAVSAALATYLFNIILMRKTGAVGVAALTIVFYINMIVNMSLFGLAQSLQPLVAYNLGAKSYIKIRKLLRIALASGGTIGISIYLAVQLLDKSIVKAFANGNTELITIASIAVSYVTIHYLFSYSNIVMGTLHTARERPKETDVGMLAKHASE